MERAHLRNRPGWSGPRRYEAGRGSWHDSYVTLVIVLAAIVIVAGVVFVAIGHGGELSVERSDFAPLELGPVSATDVVLLRPPTALWGYNVQATDEAFDQIAESIRQRDVRIVALEQLVTDLGREPATPSASPAGSPYVGARRRRDELEPETDGWQPTGTEPTSGWQTETEPASGWQTGTEPATGWQQTGTEPTTGWQQTGTEPASGWQTETEPTSGWQTGTEPTTGWPAPPPEQSHD
jgi:hypothetical protein